MSLGPEKIILSLVVALIVFGPQRLPEIARQVGSAIRELRRMQDTVRGELENVLHPDFSPPDAEAPQYGAGSQEVASIEDTDHSTPPALPPAYPAPGSYAADMAHPDDMAHRNGNGSGNFGDHADDDVTDDGFAGPRSFS
jgi:sec-independent protein translocase protein TatB